MPLPAIIAALVPILIGEVAKAAIGDTPTAGKVADTAVSIISDVSGIPINTPDDASRAVAAVQADPVKLAEVYRLQAETTVKLIAMDNEDRADARKRDLAYLSAGRRNWRGDALVGLAVCGVVACVVTLVAGQVDGNTAVGGFIIAVGTLLAGKIGTAFDFEYGSSAGSQAKDEALRSRS